MDAHNHGLVRVNKDNDSIEVDVLSFLPVKAYLCTKCGNVDLMFNPELQQQVT